MEVDLIALVALLLSFPPAYGRERSHDDAEERILTHTLRDERCVLIWKYQRFFGVDLGDMLLALEEQKKEARYAAEEKELPLDETLIGAGLPVVVGDLETFNHAYTDGYVRSQLMEAMALQTAYNRYMKVLNEIRLIDARLAKLDVKMEPISVSAPPRHTKAAKPKNECPGAVVPGPFRSRPEREPIHSLITTRPTS